MMDADPTCTKEVSEKFNSLLAEITKALQIEDDRSNIVDTLMKVESRVNFLIEARDFLNKKDLSSF
jgi:vacuolar-type H+-ATPase subunit D/Vma8